MKKNFSFTFPVTQGRIHHPESKMWSYDHVGNLDVSGTASDEMPGPPDAPVQFEISEILYQGVNVLPLLRAFGSLEQVIQAANEHVQDIFHRDDVEFLVPKPIAMNHGLAKVISLPLRKRIK